jgi:hypothetical protein
LQTGHASISSSLSLTGIWRLLIEASSLALDFLERQFLG